MHREHCRCSSRCQCVEHVVHHVANPTAAPSGKRRVGQPRSAARNVDHLDICGEVVTEVGEGRVRIRRGAIAIVIVVTGKELHRYG